MNNPDNYARTAQSCNNPRIKQYFAVKAIKARAERVLVNGKWVPRKGVMRDGD